MPGLPATGFIKKARLLLGFLTTNIFGFTLWLLPLIITNTLLMEVFIVLLLVILLFIVLAQKNSIAEKFSRLEAELKLLRDQLSKLQKSEHAQTTVKEEKNAITIIEQPPPPEKSQPVIIKKEEWVSGFKVEEIAAEKTPTVTTDTTPKPAAIVTPAKVIVPPKPGFFERNPDLEKFIGENLVSKIGIAILVLAIGFFVKYAIDNNWIGEAGRVAIGIACGGILIGLAHRLRSGYKAFSSVLVGGGLAVLYFTIALAYHQFHLFSQLVSFIIMIVITAFAVMLSILYNRQEVAIIALLGGFITPFLVSNGSGNYIALFCYLLILNIGLLVIAYYKAWRLLNLLAFIFTVLLFGGWLFTLAYNTPAVTYKNALSFATTFYLLFFSINIAYNIKEKKQFLASDFGILLANTSLYFSASLYLIDAMHANEYRGFYSAAMAIFNLAASYILFRNQKTDKNILYLLIGLTLTFVSLTAPLQLQGNFITLFWASEIVLLYWLYLKSDIKLIKTGVWLVWFAMLGSLLIDWMNGYFLQNKALPVVLNKLFLTGIYAAAANYILFIIRKKEATVKALSIFRVTAIILLYLTGGLEIYYQLHQANPTLHNTTIYLLLYSFIFYAILLFITNKVTSLQLNSTLKITLLIFALISYLLSLPTTFNWQSNLLYTGQNGYYFTVHWLLVLFTAAFIIVLIKTVAGKQFYNKNIMTWLYCSFIVTFLSIEFLLLFNQLYFSKTMPLAEIERVYVKTGLPILWGLCSFAFMWWGMKFKYRTLRIISLTLFSITLVKLFLFDIKNIPIAGKIAAFFCLGVLLLVVSFMYQRLKKILIDDAQKEV